MAERMYFFDSVEDDERIYQAADFARFHAQIIGNGVSNTASLPDLGVSVQQNMDVDLGAGYMFVNGYMYENTNAMTLTHDTADVDNDRIDRVVIRFDNNPEQRRIYAVIKKGTPSSEPVAPDVTRSNYIFEMSVAQVRIIAGKSFIDDSDITDERANDDVCGYIPLHNIYRGLEINEHGMVTMPNQSYVEMLDETDLELLGDSTINYTETIVPIRPIIDRQEEIIDGSFYAKASGVYQFKFHIALDSSLREGQKIQAQLKVNDGINDDNVYLFNQPGADYSDLHFFGSGIKHLEKGEKVSITVSTRRTGEMILSRYRRMSITKLS